MLYIIMKCYFTILNGKITFPYSLLQYQETPQVSDKIIAPVLEKAQRLVKDGKGGKILTHTDFLFCSNTSVTADTFVSYYGPGYGPGPRLDTAYMIPKIRRPILVVRVGDDGIVINDKKFLSLADGNCGQVTVVEGANHFFRDLYVDEAVDKIDTFLKSLDT